ncbi:MAG: lysophospholipid acyltransferase family protein [Alphaproteobacteria bacterium]
MLAFYPVVGVMLVVLMPTLLLSRQRAMIGLQSLCRYLMWALKHICNITYEIKGIENFTRPSLIASKHQSAWDTAIFQILMPDIVFVLKKELTYIPVYGQYLKKQEMVEVDRSKPAQALKELIKGTKNAIGQNRSVVIFPEGTRGEPGEDREYQHGIASLYKSMGMPVTPVALNSGVHWPRRSMWKFPGTITLEFLPAIEHGLNREEFMQTLKQRIDQASDNLLKEYAHAA